jgi:hypothetical protein
LIILAIVTDYYPNLLFDNHGQTGWFRLAIWGLTNCITNSNPYWFLMGWSVSSNER